MQLFLRSRREAEKACDCPWSLCGQCPALREHTHREKGLQPDPAPPLTHPQNNGKWPPRWHRLPLHTPSVVVALDSSPPPRLFLQSQHHSYLQSPSSSIQPLCALVDTSQAGENRVVALTICAVLPPLWLPQTGFCALL